MRKQRHPFDRSAYRKRNLIELAFCSLKNFRRIATRYGRRADIFSSAPSASPQSSPGGDEAKA
jgi:putative transposase